MKLVFVFAVLVLLLTIPVSAGDWLDEFDKEDLNEEWVTITFLPGGQGSATIEDGMLLINEPGAIAVGAPNGRPLVLRKAPEEDFSISALVDTNPPSPAQSYWAGLFIVGKDGDSAVLANDWAALTVGGTAGEEKVLIGSTIGGTWSDKGHFVVPAWPIHLKLEKVGDQYTGYYKANAADEWTKVGNTWAHAGMEDPELAGFGFINNWGGGPDLTLIAEYFLMQGENVTPIMAVRPGSKLSSTWGRIKLSH